MDIHDDDIPISVLTNILIEDKSILLDCISIFIGDDECLDEFNQGIDNYNAINFKSHHLDCFKNLNRYMNSEFFKFDFAHTLYFESGLKTKSIDTFEELSFFINLSSLKEELNIIAIDISYKEEK
jgi:hypothetical protein